MTELCRLHLSAALDTTQKATTNKTNKNTPRYKLKTNNKNKEIKTQITTHVKLTKNTHNKTHTHQKNPQKQLRQGNSLSLATYRSIFACKQSSLCRQSRFSVWQRLGSCRHPSRCRICNIFVWREGRIVCLFRRMVKCRLACQRIVVCQHTLS